MKLYFMILIVCGFSATTLFARISNTCISNTSIDNPNPCAYEVQQKALGTFISNTQISLADKVLLAQKAAAEVKNSNYKTDVTKTYYYSTH